MAVVMFVDRLKTGESEILYDDFH